jgi:putative membrane protein insertion efficiency factor
MRALLLWLIALYQRNLSALFGDCCRFEPSCSRYAAACVGHHGALHGSWLALLRVLRCHPLSRGGIDLPPVPEPPEPNWDRVVRLSGCPRCPEHRPEPGASAP